MEEEQSYAQAVSPNIIVHSAIVMPYFYNYGTPEQERIEFAIEACQLAWFSMTSCLCCTVALAVCSAAVGLAGSQKTGSDANSTKTISDSVCKLDKHLT